MAPKTKVRKPYESGPPRDYAAAGLCKPTIPLPVELVEKARRLARLNEVPVGTFLAGLIIQAMEKRK